MTSAGGWKTRLTVGSFQMDNHMARAHFPVVLRPAEDEDATLTSEPAKKCVPACVQRGVVCYGQIETHADRKSNS